MTNDADITALSLDELRAAVADGRPVGFRGVTSTHCVIHGQSMHFTTTMERDPIQRAHREGRFYEEIELSVIKRVLPFGGTFVDIGANIGNHSLYAARYLGARVIPFEPNPPAYHLLIANLLANGLQGRFDLSHLGFGVGDKAEGGYAMEQRERNLGGARMLPGAGSVQVRSGDHMLADCKPDLIKIDVEGMEIKVLSGLAAVIARARPWLIVEVDLENEAAFLAWVADNAYAVDLQHQRYRSNKNYVLRSLPPRVVRRMAAEVESERDGSRPETGAST